MFSSDENLWGCIQLPLKVKDIKGLVSRKDDNLQEETLLLNFT